MTKKKHRNNGREQVAININTGHLRVVVVVDRRSNLGTPVAVYPGLLFPPASVHYILVDFPHKDLPIMLPNFLFNQFYELLGDL